MTKPDYYICGAGGHIDCPYWDDIDGCLYGEETIENCGEYADLTFKEEEDEDDC